jgi:hypothetical protein
MNVLHEQNNFIQQIHHDIIGKLCIKQQPLLTQATPIEFAGNDNFYSILRTMPNQLQDLKSTILPQFITIQENIADIEKKMEQNDGLVKLNTDNRDYFRELSTHLEKNMSNQLVEPMNLYWEEKNEALEKMLNIARNTWKTIDDNRNYLEERTHFLGSRRPTQDEKGVIENELLKRFKALKTIQEQSLRDKPFCSSKKLEQSYLQQEKFRME